MIAMSDFQRVVRALGAQAIDDIEWSEHVQAPTHPDEFALEAAFVICNSGMKNTIARTIFDRCRGALLNDVPVWTVFGHKGKAEAIERIWRDRVVLLKAYHAAPDKLSFLVELPWIGEITKYHLAKNFGVDCVKPDVHLARLAIAHGTTPHDLCADLARQTRLRVATVDVVLWRACANGVIDSRTGRIAA
jgi:hypothetical protein